jgi:hypothetical protein
MVLTGGKENKRGKQTSDKICLIYSKYFQLFVGDCHPLIQILPVTSFYNNSTYYYKTNYLLIFPGGRDEIFKVISACNSSNYS